MDLYAQPTRELPGMVDVADGTPWGGEDGDTPPERRVLTSMDIQACPACDGGAHWGITLTPLPPNLQEAHDMTHAYGCPETGTTVAVQVVHDEPPDRGRPWEGGDGGWRE